MFILTFSCLIILCQNSCSSLCKTCIDLGPSMTSYRCTSCSIGYFLSGQKCFNCEAYNSTECSNNSGATPSTSDIIIPIITLLVIILVICCCFRYICNKCQEFNRQQRPRIPELPVNPSHYLIVYHPPPAANLLPETSINQLQIQSKWKRDSQKFNQKEICVICLQDGVYLQTNCKHSFHPDCLWQWVSKNHWYCPLCKSNNLSSVKVFCRRCFENYCQLNFRSIQVIVRERRWKNCSDCQKDGFL